MKKSLALASVGIMAVVAVCGCSKIVGSKKAADKVTNNLNQETTQKEKRALAPITGAFGWTLGQKLPDDYQVTFKEDSGVYRYETNGFFDEICLLVKTNREIYTIVGNVSKASLQDTEAVGRLVDVLNEKYGLVECTNTSDAEIWSFGTNKTLMLSQSGDAVHLIYFKPLEMDAMVFENQKRKAEDFKRTVDGI